MKTVLITGAARGIGAACAEGFANQGYNICINYLENDQAAESLKYRLEKQGANVMVCKADVRDAAQAEALVKETLKNFGRIDTLVNNAGSSLVKLVQDTGEEEYLRVMDTNVKGIFNMVKAASPLMIHEKSGVIVNVSSLWGVCGGAMESVYSASKAAVIGFTKALAKELGPSGIRVNCVAPGFINTDMTSCYTNEEKAAFAEGIPLYRLGEAAEAADAVCFLASEKASYITGQTLCIDGGASV